MYLFHRMGKKTTRISNSVRFFLLFLGHISNTLFCHWREISWRHTIVCNLKAGAILVIPLIIVSILIGMALALSINYMLAPYNLENQALFIVQNTVIQDIAPLPIGFVLCVHCGLNLIETDHPSLNHTPAQVLRETIIPLMAGINLTAIVLYVYVAISFCFSVFITFAYILKANTTDYVLRLNDMITPADVILSISKTMVLATIASFIASYYYYDVAIRVIPTRRAVSRIITRGIFWLIVSSALIKLLF